MIFEDGYYLDGRHRRAVIQDLIAEAEIPVTFTNHYTKKCLSSYFVNTFIYVQCFSQKSHLLVNFYVIHQVVNVNRRFCSAKRT